VVLRVLRDTKLLHYKSYHIVNVPQHKEPCFGFAHDTKTINHTLIRIHAKLVLPAMQALK
jgi:hypothetical protein